MLKILVAGNILLKQDSLPVKIITQLSKKLPSVRFEEFDPTENFPPEEKLIILDTVMGIKKVRIFEDLDNFLLPKAYSLHDFDLALNLKLMQKVGLVKKFMIIGVPKNLSQKEAVKQVVREIKSSLL